MPWKKLAPTLYYYSDKSNNAQQKKYDKIAMFDLDHTLVKPGGKRIHPKNADDWEWMDEEVPVKLKELASDGYLLVIISNQSGLASGKRDFLLDRISNIVDDIGLTEDDNLEVYVAGDNDIYRKPNTTIFEKYILPRLSGDLFYVGDAAGRKNDFSDSDRKFAYNIHILLKHLFHDSSKGIKFYTPEEFFHNAEGEKREERTWLGFDPSNFLRNMKKDKDKSVLEKHLANDIYDQQNIYIMVGPPASGKTTLSRLIAKEYENHNIEIKHINQDTCGSKIKCLKMFLEALKNNESIILDNTNPSQRTRQEYIDHVLESKPEARIYIIHMSTFDDPKKDRELYEHLNIYRERTENGKRIPDIAYNVFYKNYESPDVSLIREIFQIPFTPKFKDKKQIMQFIQKS